MTDIKNLLPPFGSLPTILLFALLLLIAFSLRANSLDADAPHHLSVSQGLTTDGPNTVYAGRNKVLFGTWSPEIEGYPAVNKSIRSMDWLSFAVFSLIGIGYWQGGFLAVILGLLTIALVATFARKHFGNRVALLSTFFLVINYPFLVYNRIPVAFTLLGLVMALILVMMGYGKTKPGFVIVAIMLSIFGAVSVKIACLSSVPMIISGSVYLARRRFSTSRLWNPILLIIVSSILLLSYFILISDLSGGVLTNLLDQRTLNVEYGIEENFRFLVVSILEFGIYSAFFVRMVPLFLLSLGYTLFTIGNLLTKNRRPIPFGEVLALSYLLGVGIMLLLSNQQPARHLILLIPPFALVGAIALEKMLQHEGFKPAHPPGYIYTVLIFMGLTYLIYQVIAALFRLTAAARLGTDVGDYGTIVSLPVLQLFFVVSMIPGFILTIIILSFLFGSRRRISDSFSMRGMRFIALTALIVLIVGDMLQYSIAFRELEFSSRDSSRKIEEDLGDGVVLGGAYSAVLGLENNYPGVIFFERPLRSPTYQRKALESGLTHIAMESASIFGDIPINDVEMRKYAPKFVDQLDLVSDYYVRGYTVNVYRIEGE